MVRLLGAMLAAVLVVFMTTTSPATADEPPPDVSGVELEQVEECGTAYDSVFTPHVDDSLVYKMDGEFIFDYVNAHRINSAYVGDHVVQLVVFDTEEVLKTWHLTYDPAATGDGVIVFTDVTCGEDEPNTYKTGFGECNPETGLTEAWIDITNGGITSIDQINILPVRTEDGIPGKTLNIYDVAPKETRRVELEMDAMGLPIGRWKIELEFPDGSSDYTRLWVEDPTGECESSNPVGSVDHRMRRLGPKKVKVFINARHWYDGDIRGKIIVKKPGRDRVKPFTAKMRSTKRITATAGKDRKVILLLNGQRMEVLEKRR